MILSPDVVDYPKVAHNKPGKLQYDRELEGFKILESSLFLGLLALVAE
jgi:hypothetical protein